MLAPAGVARLRLAGQAVAAEDGGIELAGARVQWSTVEAHGFRTTRAQNGATSDYYSNVSTEGKAFGHWLGFDRIDYLERVVAPWGAARAPGAGDRRRAALAVAVTDQK